MDILLSNGQMLIVTPVPPFALAEINRRYPVPANLSATDAQAALAEREKLAREVAWLLALPVVDVPIDWTFPRGLVYAGIQPREGESGRLLDYIEYGLLVTPADIAAVQAVMYGADVTEPEVTAAEATFQPDGGRAAYPAHTEG